MKGNHISKTQFLLEFFGLFGRELGNPTQHYTDNPLEILPFVEESQENKEPAFMSIQPRTAHKKVYGIEKLFWDFDVSHKSEELTEKQIEKRRAELEVEIRVFIYNLSKLNIVPLIVKTRRGYHVYVYFNQIHQIDRNMTLWKKVYEYLEKRFLKNNHHKYKYADSSVVKDIMRMGRIPTSTHEKSGEECIILNTRFKPDKFRSIEYYRMQGLKTDDLIQAVEWVNRQMMDSLKRKIKNQKLKKERWEINHGYVGKIRPCFKKIMSSKEAPHQLRLALLIEFYFSGYKNREELIKLFECFNDFEYSETAKQVDWFLENKANDQKTRPYRCDTLKDLGFCLEECPIYQIRKKKGIW